MHDLEFLADTEDFSLSIAADSETDHLPVDPYIRSRWSPEAVKKIDAEIESVECFYERDFLHLCRALIKQFTP